MELRTGGACVTALLAGALLRQGADFLHLSLPVWSQSILYLFVPVAAGCLFFLPKISQVRVFRFAFGGSLLFFLLCSATAGQDLSPAGAPLLQAGCCIGTVGTTAGRWRLSAAAAVGVLLTACILLLSIWDTPTQFPGCDLSGFSGIACVLQRL